jgi:hypothetical protein
MGYDHPADRINLHGKYDFLGDHNEKHQSYYYKKIWYGQDLIKKMLQSSFLKLKTKNFNDEVMFMIKSDFVRNTVQARRAKGDFRDSLVESGIGIENDDEEPEGDHYDYLENFLNNDDEFSEVIEDLKKKEAMMISHAEQVEEADELAKKTTEEIRKAKMESFW